MGGNWSTEWQGTGMKFEARVRVLARGGKVTAASDRLVVRNADQATILLAAATSFKNFRDITGDPSAITAEQIADAGKKDYDRLRRRHVTDYQELFKRVQINLGQSQEPPMPTDV